MNSLQDSNKGAFGLGVAMLMTAVLVLLNLMVNFSGSMHQYISDYLNAPLVRILINVFFFWMLALLIVTFTRWRKMSAQKHELEAIIAGIGLDALLVINTDRTITISNDAVKRIFGWTPAEVSGKKTELLYSDRRKHPDRPREIYEALENDGYHYGLATGIRRDGSKLPLEIITGTLKGVGGAVLLIRDISERVAMEAERARLEERTRQAKRLESLGVLAGGIAHDFRNILTVVRGHAELALRRQTGDTQLLNSMKEIMKGSDRAQDLCQNLLAFAGRAPRDIHPVNLSAVCRDTAEMLRVKYPEPVSFEYEFDPELPEIGVDEVQLRQVVMNLVSNAADAVGDAPGAVRIVTGRQVCDSAFFEDVEVDAEQPTGDYVCVSVIDSGCGMDEVTRQQVCEPFFTTKKQGHGMGMAAVMGIVRSHGGMIKVVSSVGKGSEFTVLLPLAPAAIPDDIESTVLR